VGWGSNAWRGRASNRVESMAMTKCARKLGAAGILSVLLAGAAGFGVRAAVGQVAANRLQTVLKQMDEGSAKFHSAQASVKKEQLEKIVNDTTTETGAIYFLRTGSSMQVGAKFDPPDAQTMEYKDGVMRLLDSTGQMHVYPATGPNQARNEGFLALGFGGSGSDLAKAWTITDEGTEQVSDGSKPVPVEKLDLVSKDVSVRNNFTHITIWVDPVRDISLKQESFSPAGDTNTTYYTNIRLNQPIDTKSFAIKCKGKCS